jgi:hypothetical protein
MLRILLVLGLAAAPLAVRADDDAPSPLKAAFGNTILSTYPDGRTAELWLHPDGAYDAEGRRQDRSNGHWQVKDGKLCLKQAHPFAFGYTYCTPIKDVHVGSTWSGKAVTGEPIQIKLVHGKVDPALG